MWLIVCDLLVWSVCSVGIRFRCPRLKSVGFATENKTLFENQIKKPSSLCDWAFDQIGVVSGGLLNNRTRYWFFLEVLLYSEHYSVISRRWCAGQRGLRLCTAQWQAESACHFVRRNGRPSRPATLYGAMTGRVGLPLSTAQWQAESACHLVRRNDRPSRPATYKQTTSGRTHRSPLNSPQKNFIKFRKISTGSRICQTSGGRCAAQKKNRRLPCVSVGRLSVPSALFWFSCLLW